MTLGNLLKLLNGIDVDASQGADLIFQIQYRFLELVHLLVFFAFHLSGAARGQLVLLPDIVDPGIPALHEFFLSGAQAEILLIQEAFLLRQSFPLGEKALLRHHAGVFLLSEHPDLLLGFLLDVRSGIDGLLDFFQILFFFKSLFFAVLHLFLNGNLFLIEGADLPFDTTGILL